MLSTYTIIARNHWNQHTQLISDQLLNDSMSTLQIIWQQINPVQFSNQACSQPQLW